MAETYTYSIAADTLNGVCDGGRLKTEINDNVTIVTECLDVFSLGDALSVSMASTLPQAEEDELDVVVGAHDGSTIVQNLSDWFVSVISRDTSAPPVSPSVGDRYLVPVGATGVWANYEKHIAEWGGSTWHYVAPYACAHVGIHGLELVLHYNGTTWEETDQATKINYGATTNPEVDDDETDSYSIGSMWVNTSADTAYICADATEGSAVWKLLTHDHSNKTELDLVTDGDHDVRTDNPHATDLENLGSGTLAELSAAVTDATLAADIEEDNIIYVGKHGSDTDDGKNIGSAVLTFTKAIQLANAQIPSSSNICGIICLDGGIYAENITFTDSYVHIFAANATLQGGVVILDDNSIEFEMLSCTTGNAVEMTTGSGTSYAQIKKLVTSGCNGVVNSSSGILNAEIELYRQTGGIGFKATSGISHADIQDWDLYGESPVAVQNASSGMMNLRTGNIADRSGTGTSIAFDCNSGTVNALVVYASVDKLYDIETGATLNLIGANLSGTEENNGTINITTAGVPASHTVASHSDTTATGTELDELTDGSTTTLHKHTYAETYSWLEEDTMPFVKVKNNTWTTYGYMVFRGSAAAGTPTEVKSVTWPKDDDKYFELRVYDTTNSQQICYQEIGGYATGGVPKVEDLGTLSNVSTGVAVWAIQGRKTQTANPDCEGRLASVSIIY